jgi:hypothetical protein
MRIVRYLLVSGSAAVAAGSLALATQAAVTAVAAPSHAVGQPSAQFLARARAALVSYLSAHPKAPPSTSSGTLAPKTANLAASAPTALAGTTAVGSFNWSGYADTSTTTNTFTKVSGQWRAPRVQCNREDQLSYEWVGIDGFTDRTVEQDGTLGWCFEHHPTYFTWWEMYPAGAIAVGSTLQPGDRVAASVTRSGTQYTLAVTDFTHPANSFSTTQACATTCLNNSVEWIAERPAFEIGIAPLADYGHWILTKASQTAGSTTGTISSYPTYSEIDMVDATGTYPLSLASPLSSAGSSFTTHWRNSY